MSKEKRKHEIVQKQTTVTEGETDPPVLSVKKKCLTPSFGCKNYLPSNPISEDDQSVMKHIRDMRGEMTKKKIDAKKTADLMDRTFAHRRQLIVKMAARIPKLKEEFPCLFDEFEV